MERASRRWPGRLGVVLLGAWALLVLAVAPRTPEDPLPDRPLLALVDLAIPVLAAWVAVRCWQAARQLEQPRRVGWRLLAAASAAFSAGAAWWLVEQVGHGRAVPHPSPVDVLFTLQVPFLLAGCCLLALGSARPVGRARVLVDVALVAGAVVFLGWALVLADLFRGERLPMADVVLASAHVLGFAAAAAVVLAVAPRGRPRWHRAHPWLVAALVLGAVDRTVFVGLLARDAYAGLHPLDVLWAVELLLLGAAAGRARDGGAAASAPGTGIVPVLTVAALIPAGAYRISRDGSLGPTLVAIGAVVFLLVVARQYLVTRDNVLLTSRLESTVARRTEQLAASERRYRSVVDHVREVVFQTDSEGRWTFLNRAWTELTGHPVATSLGRSFLEFLHPDDRADAVRELSPLVEGRLAERRRSVRYLTRTGDVRWVESWVRTTRDEDGAVVGTSGTITDVTEQREAAELLRHQAGHEALTGLPNRRSISERLATALAAGRPVGLVVLDLDRFKDLNDRHGHATGDAALVAVAERLRRSVRPGALPGRLGGDEFAIVLPGVAEAAQVQVVAERVRGLVDAPLVLDGRAHTLGASVGWTFAPADGETLGTLLVRADMAMYAAKANGGGVVRWSPGLEKVRRERLELAEQLRRGIASDQLVLHYQPIVALGTGRVGHVEALVRWAHPDRGLLGPDRFVPVAEDAGLIADLTDWVLRRAEADSRGWRSAGLRVGTTVNLSASCPFELRWRTRARTWSEHLRAGRVAGPLELEITESAVMQDTDRACRVLRELAGQGISVAIDDFGTGWSSLAQLKRLPVQRLKMDRSLVHDIATDPRAAAMARAVIEMGHTLQLDVVAEGVENPDVAAVLTGLGCDYAQGWHFGRPVPAEQVGDALGLPGAVLPGPRPSG